MDIRFLEKYYELNYPDTFMVHAIEADETCMGLYNNIMQLEGKVETAMRSMGKDYLELHEKLFSLKGQMDERMMLLAYLQGAKDREDMLK